MKPKIALIYINNTGMKTISIVNVKNTAQKWLHDELFIETQHQESRDTLPELIQLFVCMGFYMLC